MGCPQAELFRIAAVDAQQKTATVPATMGQSLIVHNALAAPIWISFSGSDPVAPVYDLVVPGEALFTYPINGVTTITARVRYSGAVPPADANQFAIFLVSAANMGATVGPLNV
jgi:hypothetical protein